MATIVAIARDKGVSGFLGDGSNRWPAVHRLDSAHLFCLALENAPAGSTLHGVADEGVPIRDIAEVIGRHLSYRWSPSLLPTQPRTSRGWPASSVSTARPRARITRELLGWQPVATRAHRRPRRGPLLRALSAHPARDALALLTILARSPTSCRRRSVGVGVTWRAARATTPSMTTSMAKRNRSSPSPATISAGVGETSGNRSGGKPAKVVVDLVDLLAAMGVVAAAASAPHIVLTGDGRHQQHEDVARPGGVLGVDRRRRAGFPAGSPSRRSTTSVVGGSSSVSAAIPG